MTEGDSLVELLKKHAHARGMYETLELNDYLLLHNLAILELTPGPAFVNVTCLSLENNGLRNLVHLSSQFPRLKYLNVNHNLLSSLDFKDFCGLEDLQEIHAAHNSIQLLSSIDSGRCLTLKKLNLSHNKLTNFPHFCDFQFLEVLDLSRNQIATEAECMLSSLRNSLPSTILQLYLSPNAFIGDLKNYRKSILSMFDKLLFLDSAAVTHLDRQLATVELNEGKTAATLLTAQRNADAKNCMSDNMAKFREFQAAFCPVQYEIDQLKLDISSLCSQFTHL